MPSRHPDPSVLRLIVSVSVLEPAIHFYRDVLGLELRDRRGEFACLLTRDNVEVMLHERSTTPSDTSVAVGFAVDDLIAIVEAWKTEGGIVVDEPMWRPWGETMAVIRDVDGHLVCLSAR
ncbi:VOC family protein [Glaciibacter flavus]|uniref:VOC family protein n=1 Tax=Orlajensenia flava TaxID=2565934 RepID=UPI003B00D0E5